MTREQLNEEKQQEIFKEQNKENIESQINNILDDWNNRYQKLAYYIEHDELEKVNEYLINNNLNFLDNN